MFETHNRKEGHPEDRTGQLSGRTVHLRRPACRYPSDSMGDLYALGEITVLEAARKTMHTVVSFIRGYEPWLEGLYLDPAESFATLQRQAIDLAQKTGVEV